MQRILLSGISGVGKSTVNEELLRRGFGHEALSLHEEAFEPNADRRGAAGIGQKIGAADIFDQPCAPAIAVLERELAAQGRSPGKASIFRSLKLLTNLGIVRRVHGVTECHRYTLAGAHADQIVCTICGRLITIVDDEVAALKERLEQASGFAIHGHLLSFFGYCPTCQATS